MSRRSLTELAQSLRDAYRPTEPVVVQLEPGDHEALAKLIDLVDWAREDPGARAAFNGWRAKRRVNHASPPQFSEGHAHGRRCGRAAESAMEMSDE